MTKATRSIYIMISSHTVVHLREFFIETALMHRIVPIGSPGDPCLAFTIRLRHTLADGTITCMCGTKQSFSIHLAHYIYQQPNSFIHAP